MNDGLMVGVLVVAALVSALSPLIWKRYLERAGTFDVPNHRSSHTEPTLRGGGLAPMTGIIVAGLVAGLVFESSKQTNSVFLVISFSLLICWVGLVEDMRGIPAKGRAFLQLALGLAFGALISNGIEDKWIWIPLIGLFFAANVNFVNFMDGVNGISGMFAVVVGIAYGIIGWIEGQHWLLFCGLVLAAVFAPFLRWNLRPPGMFLGDVGSYLLGGLTATIIVAGISAGVNPVAMIAPVSIYWIDTVSTLAKRLLRHEPILEPHRTHIYQQLTDRGFSHLTVALIVALYSATVAIIGLPSLSMGYGGVVILLAALIVVWAAYIALPIVLKARKVVS